jgi:hypothetical protein
MIWIVYDFEEKRLEQILEVLNRTRLREVMIDFEKWTLGVLDI